MNKGTPEGTEEEISYVKRLNKKKDLKTWHLLLKEPEATYGIHVTTHKVGIINESKIKPKADLFLAEGNVPEDYLKKHDYYLNEDDIKSFNLEPIQNTGISVKRIDSKKYQIMKMNPSTFKKIFGSFELGAGASIYCNKSEELIKNDSVLKGWNTTWDSFFNYFEDIKNIKILNNHSESVEKRLEIAKVIKNISNKKIYDLINTNDKISKFIFQGIGNFEEPFTAHWFFEQGELRTAGKIPFVVTTGSGRSKGDFTIVIKPKI